MKGIYKSSIDVDGMILENSPIPIVIRIERKNQNTPRNLLVYITVQCSTIVIILYDTIEKYHITL